MTTLLASSSATSPTATEGDVKTYLSNIRAFMADLLGTDSANKAAVQVALSGVLNSSVSKSSAYTVISSDRGKVINATGTWTLSIASASTLGDGFCFAVWNTGSGSITIDPSLSETIDGGVNKTIGAGKFAIVYCNGSSFGTVGLGFALADLLAVDGAGSGLDADLLDGYHANNLPYAGINKNFDWELCYSSLGLGAEINLLSNYGAGSYLVVQSTGMCHFVNVIGAAIPDVVVSVSAASVEFSGMSTSWATRSTVRNNTGTTCSVYKLRKTA